MSRITLQQAKDAGFEIDHCVYPPLAYKGTRFHPTATKSCYTKEEEFLYKLLREALNALTTSQDTTETEVKLRSTLSNAGFFP